MSPVDRSSMLIFKDKFCFVLFFFYNTNLNTTVEMRDTSAPLLYNRVQ